MDLKEFTKKEINKYFEKHIDELSIFKALNIYDSLQKQFNNFYELIEDWYALQNYKRYKEINDNYKFIKFLCETELEKLEKDIYLSKKLNKEDLKHIKKLSEIAKDIYSEKSKLEDFLKKKATTFYPNLTNILGPILTLRMLNFTKNLESFSKLPASTIQLIGAETALFRHLKYNKKSPKYGFLYQHPLMQGLKNHNKGKLARFIANKIVLASKLDLAKKIDDNLKKQIEEKANSLKK